MGHIDACPHMFSAEDISSKGLQKDNRWQSVGWWDFFPVWFSDYFFSDYYLEGICSEA